jgi:hypothetical protein
LVFDLISSLEEHKIKITGADLFNPQGYHGLLLDCRSGDLFNLSALLPFNSEESRRCEETLRYLERNPGRRVLRLV